MGPTAPGMCAGCVWRLGRGSSIGRAWGAHLFFAKAVVLLPAPWLVTLHLHLPPSAAAPKDAPVVLVPDRMSSVQKRARQEAATPGDLGDATPEPKRSRRSTANPSLKERPALTLVFEHDDCGGHETCTPGAPHQEAADRLTAVHRAIARMDGVVFTSDFEPASLAALQHVHSDGLIEAVWQLCRKRDMAGQRRPSGWLAEAPEACSGAEGESLGRASWPKPERASFHNRYGASMISTRAATTPRRGRCRPCSRSGSSPRARPSA